MNSNGILVVEVPHANDFLLTIAKLPSFKSFTLWSQHLVLHTRESLKRLLYVCDFTKIIINSRQRYPLSNHLNWMINGEPGGHKTLFSVFDDVALNKKYAKALASIDATDTLVAYAKVT